MKIAQLAFSVADLEATLRFYEQGLGFVQTGKTQLTRGKQASKIQGISNVASTCGWMVDPARSTQLEFFQFERPMGRRRSSDWRPCDIGYSGFAVKVRQFAQTWERLKQCGAKMLAPPERIDGYQWGGVIDPNGVLLELIEAGPEELNNNVCSKVVGITMSVANIERSRRFFIDTLGTKESEIRLPSRESLWGLPPAMKKSLLVCGGPCWLEIREYLDLNPRARPEDYRLSDLGIVNCGFRVSDADIFDETYKQTVAHAYKANSAPVAFPGSKVVYLNDDQGFSVELYYSSPWLDTIVGRSPPSLIVKIIYAVLGVIAVKLDDLAYRKLTA